MYISNNIILQQQPYMINYWITNNKVEQRQNKILSHLQVKLRG